MLSNDISSRTSWIIKFSCMSNRYERLKGSGKYKQMQRIAAMLDALLFEGRHPRDEAEYQVCIRKYCQIAFFGK